MGDTGRKAVITLFYQSSILSITRVNSSVKDLFAFVFNLSSLELEVLFLLIKNNPKYLTLEGLSRKVARDKSTIHRSLQKLVNERIVHKEIRTQKERGYYHIYRSVDHQSLKTETEKRIAEIEEGFNRLLSNFEVDLQKLD
jgi:predicted transcriptional regulator